MAAEAIPPPYAITADDKRGLLVVTGAVVLAYVWVCLLIRIWLRRQTREWRADDWALGIATFLHTAQTALVFHGVNLGLGASLDGFSLSQLKQLGKQGFASQLLYIYILLVSKLSVLLLYLRLSPGLPQRIASWALIAASGVWAIIATVLIAIPCNPLQAFIDSQNCANTWPRWQAIGALDIVTEVCIFLIAIQLVWGLQMRLNAKLLVVFAFSARLPVIAIAIVRLHFLYQRVAGNTMTFEYVVATEWHLGYAIMSSTITGMGPFLRPFTKEYTTSNYKRSGYGHSSGRSTQPNESADRPALRPRASWRSQSYLMETLPSRRGSKATLPDSSDQISQTKQSSSHISHGSTSTTVEPAQYSPSSQAPIMLTADEEFRPVDHFKRHEAEVWVGDRSLKSGRRDATPRAGEESKLVVNKRTEFRVERDRASRVI